MAACVRADLRRLGYRVQRHGNTPWYSGAKFRNSIAQKDKFYSLEKVIKIITFIKKSKECRMIKYKKRRKYKYTLVDEYSYKADIRVKKHGDYGPLAITAKGNLKIKPGYAWMAPVVQHMIQKIS